MLRSAKYAVRIMPSAEICRGTMCGLFAVNAMMNICTNRIKNKNLRGGTCEKKHCGVAGQNLHTESN